MKGSERAVAWQWSGSGRKVPHPGIRKSIPTRGSTAMFRNESTRLLPDAIDSVRSRKGGGNVVECNRKAGANRAGPVGAACARRPPSPAWNILAMLFRWRPLHVPIGTPGKVTGGGGSRTTALATAGPAPRARRRPLHGVSSPDSSRHGVVMKTGGEQPRTSSHLNPRSIASPLLRVLLSYFPLSLSLSSLPSPPTSLSSP